jgi:hypothetical protein
MSTLRRVWRFLRADFAHLHSEASPYRKFGNTFQMLARVGLFWAVWLPMLLVSPKEVRPFTIFIALFLVAVLTVAFPAALRRRRLDLPIVSWFGRNDQFPSLFSIGDWLKRRRL